MNVKLQSKGLVAMADFFKHIVITLKHQHFMTGMLSILRFVGTIFGV